MKKVHWGNENTDVDCEKAKYTGGKQNTAAYVNAQFRKKEGKQCKIYAFTTTTKREPFWFRTKVFLLLLF